MYNKLVKWSGENFNDLPWRKKRTVYRTLVSEIMLQQTTVGTVKNHFDRFLSEYPTIEKLANSTEEEICISWKGLGYYRRARNLRKAAIYIVENHNSRIPKDYEKLKLIPGIGEYTANAIMSIGQNQDALSIDANIERVISRIYGIKGTKGPKLQKLIKDKYEQGAFKEVQMQDGRLINEALMDLGRVFCQARSVDCFICPMNKTCIAGRTDNPLDYPEVPVKKIKKTYTLDLLRVIVTKKDLILGYEKSEDEWLSSQVECPTYIIHTEDLELKQYPKLVNEVDYKNLKFYKTSITKYKIVNYILELTPAQFKKFSTDKKFNFVKNDRSSNLSTATIKAIAKI